MIRSEFEQLRDMPDKQIRESIRFKRSRNTSPLLRAEDVVIENSAGVELLLDISWNPIRGSKSFNVTLTGVGPICRLDVDGPPHAPMGPTHKHALQGADCPDTNLPLGVVDIALAEGQSLRRLFQSFCEMSNIVFSGTFFAPDEDDPHA